MSCTAFLVLIMHIIIVQYSFDADQFISVPKESNVIFSNHWSMCHTPINNSILHSCTQFDIIQMLLLLKLIGSWRYPIQKASLVIISAFVVKSQRNFLICYLAVLILLIIFSWIMLHMFVIQGVWFLHRKLTTIKCVLQFQ